MNDQMTIDNNPSTDLVKIEEIDGEARVDSREIAIRLGNEHKNVIEMIRKHEQRLQRYGRVAFKTIPLGTNGGYQQFTVCYLNEKQATFLVTLSRNSEKAVELKQSLVDSYFFYKEGKQLAVPKTFSEALQLAADQAKKIEEQEKQLIEAKPKVETYNHIEASINSIPVAQFANLITKKGYKIGQNKLFQWFYDHKYLIRSDRPYQSSLDNGWFEIRKVTYLDNEEKERTAHKVLVTGKGQMFFIQKILKSNKVISV